MSEWRQWKESEAWMIKETQLAKGWLTEFRRPEKWVPQDGRCDVFVTVLPFHIHSRTYLEKANPLFDPLVALSLTYHFKEKYGERSADGSVRSAGAEGDRD